MSAPTIPPAAASEGQKPEAADVEDAVLEQHHQLDEDPTVDAAFAALAAKHPEHCHKQADYPDWTPGGAK